MSTNDLMNRWATMSLEEIEQELASGQQQEAAEQLLGSEELEAVQQAAATRSVRGRREHVVLLPGIMGSLLTSIRGVTSLLWINPAILLKGQSRYLELNEAGTGDASPMVEVAPLALEKTSYLKIALTLRKEAILYEFPYDWRRRVESNADLLHETLERWSDGDPNRQFTLVGHSMGGIVSRAYMTRHPQAAERRVRRLIMHGTPHFGAAGAVSDIAQGNRLMAVSDKLNDGNDMRRLLFGMPSAYQLLPPPPDLFPAARPYPANWDLYDAAAWRLDGIRQDYLDIAREFHQVMSQSDPQVDMVEIAGCHLETTVALERSFGQDERPRYRLERPDEGPDSGDGTVPLWSATLPQARMFYVQEVHRDLPKNQDVIEATLDLIYGNSCDLPSQLPAKKSGLFGFRAAVGSPEAEAARLRARLEDGTASAEDLQSLYFMGQ